MDTAILFPGAHQIIVRDKAPGTKPLIPTGSLDFVANSCQGLRCLYAAPPPSLVRVNDHIHRVNTFPFRRFTESHPPLTGAPFYQPGISPPLPAKECTSPIRSCQREQAKWYGLDPPRVGDLLW